MSVDWLTSALEAHKRGDYAGALRACVRVPQDRESQTRAHAIRAAVLAKLGRPAEALSEIEAAIRLGASSVALHTMAARIHAARGDRRAAREWIDRALRDHPSSRQLLELREQIVLQMHLLTGLHDHFELAVALHPTWPEPRGKLIAVLMMVGLYEAAETHVDAALAQEPHRTDLYVHRAIIAIETGRGAAALPPLDRALALSQTASERARIAQLLVKAGALTRARQVVEENLALAPTAPEARLQAGFFAVWRGDVDAAERAVRQSRSQTPGVAKLGAAIGLVVGDHGAALIAASDALHEQPTDAEALALRAAALFLSRAL
jgi:tetratricopeptide (TPR) repeat protein